MSALYLIDPSTRTVGATTAATRFEASPLVTLLAALFIAAPISLAAAPTASSAPKAGAAPAAPTTTSSAAAHSAPPAAASPGTPATARTGSTSTAPGAGAANPAPAASSAPKAGAAPAAPAKRVVVVLGGFFANDDPSKFAPRGLAYGAVDLEQAQGKLIASARRHFHDTGVAVATPSKTHELLDCPRSAEQSVEQTREQMRSLEVLDRIASLDVAFKKLQATLKAPVPACKGWQPNDLVLYIAGLETRPPSAEGQGPVAVLGAFWFKEDRSFAGLNIEPYDQATINTQRLVELADKAAFPK